MISERNKTISNLVHSIGYILGYFIFTTSLFLILTILHKIPSSWNFFNIMAVTLSVTIIGNTIKRALK